MMLSVPVASHLVGFTRQAPVTARSGIGQGPGPQDFQDALAVRRIHVRAAHTNAEGKGQRILGPINAPREGLKLRGREKAAVDRSRSLPGRGDTETMWGRMWAGV